MRVSQLEQKAKDFATYKHEGQFRKYTGEPYIVHPGAVVELVKSVPHTEDMVCAAWLHDTVEDTDTTISEIYYSFNVTIAYYVEMLTDLTIKSDGNRMYRKGLERRRIARAIPQIKTIKLADLIDNTKSIVAQDSTFAKIYLKEKLLLLRVLKEGQPKLWTEANRIASVNI